MTPSRFRPDAVRLRRSRLCLIVIALLLVLFLFEEIGIALIFTGQELPSLDPITDFEPPQTSEVFDRRGTLLTTWSTERRRLVDLDEVPPLVVKAFLAAEDAEFFDHDGIDLAGISRAALTNLASGEVRQGGSTITQQVVRLACLTRRRTYTRKIQEAMLARRLEHKLDKDRILEVYLNLVYFGAGAYGIDEAARTYFGVPASQLSLGQGALLAGILQSPNRLSPLNDLDAAKKREAWVLGQMVEKGFITPEQARRAVSQDLKLHEPEPEPPAPAPYYLNAVRQQLTELLGPDRVEVGGLKIFTGLDLTTQEQAEQAVREQLLYLDRKLRGVKPRLHPVPQDDTEAFLAAQQKQLTQKPLAPGDQVRALIVGASSRYVELKVGEGDALLPFKGTPWHGPRRARRKRRARATNAPMGQLVDCRVVKVEPDRLLLSLDQEPELEGALVAIDPATREVRALVGGYDFNRSQYNRALQARRPPGSAMKPIVYSAAFSTRRWTAASAIQDKPFVLHTDNDFDWKPKNYSRRYYGLTTLHEALVHSRNVITVRLAQRIGIEAVIDRARELGISEDFIPDLALSLGAQGVSLMEMTNAYAVFAAEGRYAEPVLITRIEDREGRVLYEAPHETREALPPGEAYLMTHLLREVVEDGTARRARAIHRRSAGKTGTTSDYRDAWYLGFTPQLVAGVWIGRDDFSPIGPGMTGGSAALPAWVDFMGQAMRGVPRDWFDAPKDVYFASVDAGNGRRPNSDSSHVIRECFLKGTRPLAARPAKEKEEEKEEKPEEGAKPAGEEQGGEEQKPAEEGAEPATQPPSEVERQAAEADQAEESGKDEQAEEPDEDLEPADPEPPPPPTTAPPAVPSPAPVVDPRAMGELAKKLGALKTP